MKFDKTFIVIRDRSVLEVLDLSLHVMVDHFRQLFCLLLIGAAPWIALDWWIAGWMVNSDQFSGVYFWIITLLVISQAQVATTFMTQYLGEAMFVGRPGIVKTIRDVFRTSPYFLWSHGALRLVVPIAIVTIFLKNIRVADAAALYALVIPGMVLLACLVRSFRPFVSEILLLEKTPISKKEPSQINFSARSSMLHRLASPELFMAFILTVLFGSLLTYSLYSMFLIVDNVLNIRSNAEYSFASFYWQAALWIVAGFMAVVRFLIYIHVRIRQEGWAVELRMRAEGHRLADAIK